MHFFTHSVDPSTPLIINFKFFVGNPTFDIARHLVLCVEGTLRRKIEQYIIEFYYQKLQKYCTNASKLEGFSIENVKIFEIEKNEKSIIF
jgi:hypothetical protein